MTLPQGLTLQAVRDLAWAGQHERAIEECARALRDATLPAGERLAWLDLRSASLAAQGLLDDAMRDAGRCSRPRAGAGRRESIVQALEPADPGPDAPGPAPARAGRGRGVGASPSVTPCRCSRRACCASARHSCAPPSRSRRSPAPSARSRCSRAAGDEVALGRAHWLVAFAHSRLSHDALSIAAAQRACALARSHGDALGLGHALNVLGFSTVDIAERIALTQQAVDAYTRCGDVFARSLALGNLSLAYAELGLYRRAIRVGGETVALCRAVGATQNLALQLGGILAWRVALGQLDAAAECWSELRELSDALDLPLTSALRDVHAAEIALARGDARAAVRSMRGALRAAPQGMERDLPLVVLAQALLADGRPAAALRASARAACLHRADGLARANFGRSQDIWWWHSRALAANGRDAAAWRALCQAHELLLQGVANVRDDGLRRSFLNRVSVNREIVRAWLGESGARGVAPAQRLAHLKTEGSLGEPLERLVDAGTRMNRIRSSSELQEFLIDEVAELSGAERVLLLLEADDGARVAGSWLPRDENPGDVLEAIAPWLEAARRSRVVALHRGPAGAAEVDQRSCLVAPLVAQDRLLGFVYADIDGAFGRFGDADADLLAMLAAQAAVALDNAHWAQGLERKVEARTRELSVALDQQIATASVLQVVGSSMADAQPVFEKILDCCEVLFDAVALASINLIGDDGRLQLAAIRAGRAAPERAEAEALIERVRAAYPAPLAGSGTAASIAAGRTLNVPDLLHGEGVPPLVRELAQRAGRNGSQLFAPLMHAGRGIGSIVLTRPALGGFDEREQSLLQTFADQAAISIQNARLFNETKEALEQQTATAEAFLLRVISNSMADARPVFEMILRSCRRLFDADELVTMLVGDDGLLHLGAAIGPDGDRRDRGYTRPVAGSATEVAIRQRHVLHYPDVRAADDMPDSLRQMCRRAGIRSALMAPMLWNDARHRLDPRRAHAPEALRRQGDRPAQDLRRPGRDRDPERAAVQRDQGGARAADRHRRGAAGDQQFGGRHRAGVRQDPRKLPASVRRHQLGIFLLDDDGMVHLGVRDRRGARRGREELSAASGRRQRRSTRGDPRAPRRALSRRARRRRRARTSLRRSARQVGNYSR